MDSNHSSVQKFDIDICMILLEKKNSKTKKFIVKQAAQQRNRKYQCNENINCKAQLYMHENI